MAERVPSRREAIAYLRLVMLGALIGIPAAFLAAVFLALVHQIEHWLWDDRPGALGESSPPWYLVIGLPLVGAAVVFVARRFLPGDGGHPPLDGLASGPTPLLVYAPSIVLAAIGTLGFLTLIEGIDSDVAGTLRAAGIATWAALPASDAERLRSVVRTDDASLAGRDPTSWPEQAALALASRWADLKALQARVRVAP